MGIVTLEVIQGQFRTIIFIVGFGKCCATLGEDVVLKVINGKPVVVSDTFDSNAYT